MEKLNIDIARDYIDKFPGFPTQSIARKIALDYPARFNVEQARNAVRSARGVGGLGRKYDSERNKSYYRDSQEPGDPFGNIPEPLSEYKETWGAVEIDVKKSLVLSDIHVPFHDKESLILALKHGIDVGCDSIILNGDFCDFFRLSKFRKDVTVIQFKEEIDIVIETLRAIREIFGDGAIYFKEGNHEERLESYLQVRAPELLGIAEFSLREILKLNDLGIKYIGEKRPIKIDHLYIIHGHEFVYSSYNPVNPARGYFLRARTICLGAHYHQTSEHTETALDGKVTSVWSTGCLSDLHPKYMPINKWNHGFAVVDMSKDSFCVDNLKIINGTVF